MAATNKAQLNAVISKELSDWVDGQLEPGQSRSQFVGMILEAYKSVAVGKPPKESKPWYVGRLPLPPPAPPKPPRARLPPKPKPPPPPIPEGHQEAPDGWVGDWEGVDMVTLWRSIGVAEYEGKSALALRLRALLPSKHPRKIRAEDLAPDPVVEARPVRKKWGGP